MVKLKNPLLSFTAQGGLAQSFTFLRRRKTNIVEAKPFPEDAQSEAQISWRHMYTKCLILWRALSSAEKQDWESLARSKHMTGFAYWQSQCLRPNPGIYLPLQGGTMQGDIDLDKFRLLKLPLPTNDQEAASKKYHDDNLPPGPYTAGARVYNNADFDVPNNTWTYVPFNSQEYDTDGIHSTTILNTRLTCQTAGIYCVAFNFIWEWTTVGIRRAVIDHNAGPGIAATYTPSLANNWYTQQLCTIVELAVGDYLRVKVYQNSGAALFIEYGPRSSPYFEMQRIG